MHAIQGRRNEMEDAHVAVPESEAVGVDGFFGVYDGHGGQRAADYVAEHLHANVFASDAFAAGDLRGAMMEGFAETERAFLECDLIFFCAV